MTIWKLAASMALAFWPVIGHAGSSVCWSGRFAGLHDASDRAEAALGDATRDSSHVIIYFEKVGGYYFYQSNYVPVGEQRPAKIVSSEPMTIVDLLGNVLLRRIAGSHIDTAMLVIARRNVTFYSGLTVTDSGADANGSYKVRTPIVAPLTVAWSRPTLAELSY